MTLTMKHTSTLWQLVLAVCALATIVACGEPDVYNSYVALPNTGWGQDSLTVFRVDIADNNQPYESLSATMPYHYFS